MHGNLRTLRLLAIPLFIAVIGISPAAFGDAGDTMGQAANTDDAAVAANVRAALIADPQLKTTLVNVIIDDGAVQLSGIVRTKDQEAEAVKVANKVDGVKSVEDDIEVKDFLKE